jgi:hypothetical protein
MSQNRMRKTKFEYPLHRDTELFFLGDLACRLHKVKITMVLELNPGGNRILFFLGCMAIYKANLLSIR